LKPGGHLLFEIGVGQERQVTLLFARTYRYEPPVAVRDSAGEPRVLIARMK
jgi:release factor glutamine methyltransferase